MAVWLAGSAQGLSAGKYFYIGRNVILFGYHIHHFYFGFIMICYAAWNAIVNTEKMDRNLMAIIFGAGLGLFMDEIGMLLTWGRYHNRLTLVLSFALAIVFLNIIFFPSFWNEVRKSMKRSSSGYARFLLRHNHFIKVPDFVSENTGHTERVSLIFTGLVFLSIGVLILFYPAFVHYWVAGGFFIQGIASLARAWYNKQIEDEQPPK